jgi:hypothetical protein
MLVLFFDTFISSGVGDKGGSYQSDQTAQVLANFRESFPLYKWQRKIDIVKYTLCSYADVKWDKVVINYECEDKFETESFYAFCHELFPEAQINKQRSATADHYSNALSALDIDDDAWIFFSPNNDHPYLAEPRELKKYMSLVEKVARKYPKNDIGLLFSHFTESVNDNRITDPQWGYFGFKFKKIVSEDELAYVTTSNIAPLDSIHIFRLDYLKKIFSSTVNKGRVIRLEDTEFCSSPDHSVIQICPKTELCRHYDGYTHLMDVVPPLFIPPGFFDANIKIRYGYDQRRDGWVNINPSVSWLNSEVDLPTLLEDVPHFWQKRISEVDVNPDFKFNVDRNELAYYQNFSNPFRNQSKIFNLSRSLYIYCILQSWKFVRAKLRNIAIRLGIFDSLKNFKNRICPGS